MRKALWTDGWQFVKKEYDEQSLDCIPDKEAEWEQVDIPHDWLIYDTEDLYQDSIGWYKKSFDYTDEGQVTIVRFIAVYMNSTIYLNGKEIYTWKYGYSTFDVDLTPYLVDGKNELVVRVVHQSPNSRWYSGAGIIRNVWLYKLPKMHFNLDGVYITPKLVQQKIAKESAEKCAYNGLWSVNVEAEICDVNNYVNHNANHNVNHNVNHEGGPHVTLRSVITSPAGDIVTETSEVISFDEACKDTSEASEASEALKVSICTTTLEVDNPLLWDIAQGNVYRLTLTMLDKEGNIIDETTSPFGFRTIEFDAQKGFFINGRHEKIKGSCEHHGFSALGAVANKSALRKKLLKLREMGVNAIRTSHNMPSPEFMELADEMGFLVDSESFDCWGKPKTTYDYGRFFNEWYKKDIASWIRRDRNHPSIIMWSVGNEIYDMHQGQIGYDELKLLVEEVKKHDPNGHAPTTFASNYMRWEGAQSCSPLVDLVGYNYGEYLYDEHHEKHPEWIIYGSETASMVASRGVYHFPLEKTILCEDDQQCSALGNSFAGWGAHKYLDNIIADRDREYSLGQFIWTGFDYFGEPTPYHTRNSYFGMVDTAGFEKDPFYIYQAEWTDYKTNPMVHVFPYWDFNEGQIVDVCVCSNAPCVELFVNGKSQGKKSIDHSSSQEEIPHWSVAYEKGEITAKAYDENGKEIATDSKHSFGETKSLEVKITETDDLIFAEIFAKDADGYIVENANDRVMINVEGAGKLLGLDNGDSTDFEQVKKNTRRLFNGRLLAIVKPEQLAQDTAQCTAQNATNQEAGNTAVQSCALRITASLASDVEIPIRKIELNCEGPLKFTPERRTITVGYKLLPENATYNDIQVKLVNDIGIPVQFASFEHDVEKKQVNVTANGDGEFWLRMIAMNGHQVSGTPVTTVRSNYKFTVEGLGMPFINPYETISTGICLNRPNGLSEGIDHGVRFLGKELTRIYFDPMDFGRNSSGEMVMEIFKYTEEPVSIAIYDGEELVATTQFAQSAQWLECKEHRVLFDKPLSGVKNISIESSDNFQLKTFGFEKTLRGFSKIYAKDCDEIFGDSYTKTAEFVEGIGNNTTLVFDDIDFGDKKAGKICLRGKTNLPNTTIHMKVEADGISRTELLEFAFADEYTERTFDIEEIRGNAKVSFVFLPGSQFDFSDFMFS